MWTYIKPLTYFIIKQLHTFSWRWNKLNEVTSVNTLMSYCLLSVATDERTREKAGAKWDFLSGNQTEIFSFFLFLKEREDTEEGERGRDGESDYGPTYETPKKFCWTWIERCRITSQTRVKCVSRLAGFTTRATRPSSKMVRCVSG